MEGTKLGLKETTEVCDLIVDMVKVGIEIGKDGKVSVEDVTTLFRLIPVVGPAFDNLKAIPEELKDMDPSEAAELVAHVATRLALENEKAQVITEKSLKCAVSIYDLVKTITA